MSSTPAPPPIALDLLLQVAEEADRYALHAALDARFGRRGEAGYLWALGRVPEGAAVRVRLAPDHPAAAGGLPILAPPAGAALPFRLAANITRKHGRTGERRAWPREEMAPREAWLSRRGAEHGFRVDALTLTVGRVFIRKQRGFWLDETLFTGTLTVTDAARFAVALREGVGQRGAFGFGLLETF
jgi:hypothetical protein